MRIEQQPGYVLHARPYRETSLLLECLTRDFGRIGLVARGVRAARGSTLRANLEPFQPIYLDFQRRGELATLRTAEAAAPAARLKAELSLLGLYLNELVTRLCPRDDPHPGVFEAYQRTLQRLLGGEPAGWSLRRFERDLLAELGYAMQLDGLAEDGAALDPLQWYRYQPEEGLWLASERLAHAVRGEDLIAYGLDQPPSREGLVRLRRMMRELIRAQLGGGELQAWKYLAALQWPKPAIPAVHADARGAVD